MIRQSKECENYSIFAIGYNNGTVSISYEIRPIDAPSEQCIVNRSDKPHKDFIVLWQQLVQIAKRFLEFPLLNAAGEPLQIQIVKVKYIDSNKYGEGYQLTVNLWNLCYANLPLRLTTHKFYQKGVDVKTGYDGEYLTQMIEPTEKALFDKLAKEAFAYAYYGKREQPTLDEAMAAEQNDGKFKDEM